MKLLICTQALDQNDPALGFFARWVEEFSKHCQLVTVICLRKGEYQLPGNVRVFALGGGNTVSRAYKLIKGAWKFRNNYDNVLVHMNPEFIIAGGIVWHLLHKKIGFWYTHKAVNLRLRLATHGADTIFTASRESFRLASPKVRVMGHGIDTDFFNPDPSIKRGDQVLSAGRLDKSKRHDLTIRAMQYLPRDLWVAGSGPELEHLQQEASRVQVSARVHFLGARTQAQMRELYCRAGVFAHTSTTGSLDKVVLEALACGCPVVSTSESLGNVPVTKVPAEPKALAAALARPLPADPSYVREHHSLKKLVSAIIGAF